MIEALLVYGPARFIGDILVLSLILIVATTTLVGGVKILTKDDETKILGRFGLGVVLICISISVTSLSILAMGYASQDISQLLEEFQRFTMITTMTGFLILILIVINN